MWEARRASDCFEFENEKYYVISENKMKALLGNGDIKHSTRVGLVFIIIACEQTMGVAIKVLCNKT